MMEEPALVAERAVVAGPRFDDELQRFGKALVRPDRIAVASRNLVGHATHEARLEAAVRQHVNEGHLLGDAHRLPAIGDGIAENQ